MQKKLKKHTTRGTYTQKVLLDDKIEIIERFIAQGGTLTSSTVFEGYSIGLWDIQIRNLVNRHKLILTPQQEERLKKLGRLERKFDKTIDEKIKDLIKWNAKYPKAICKQKSVTSKDIAILVEYANLELDSFISKTSKNLSEAEKSEKREKIYNNIYEQYNKMNKYYEYIYQRKNEKKLTPKQEEKCKEGKVRGIFGYPKLIEELSKKYNVDCEIMLEFSDKFDTMEQLEETLTDLSRKYRISEEKIAYIVNNYGTVENFIAKYIWDDVKDKDFNVLGECLRGTEGSIDINLEADSKLDKLMTILRNEKSWHEKLYLPFALYDSRKLLEQIENLDEKDQEIIINRFELYGIEKKPLRKIAKEKDKTGEAIRQREKKILNILRSLKNEYQYNFNNIKLEELRDEEIHDILDISGKVIFKPDTKYQDNSNQENLNEVKNLLSILEKIDRSIRQFNTKSDYLKQSDMEAEAILQLRKEKREDYTDCLSDDEIVQKIDEIKRELLPRVRNEFAKAIIEEILDENKEELSYRTMKEPDKKDEIIKDFLLDSIRNVSVDSVGFSKRSLGGLKGLQIRTIGDLEDRNYKDISDRQGLGVISIDEIFDVKNRYKVVNDSIVSIFRQKANRIQANITIEEIGLPIELRERLLCANIKNVGDLQLGLSEIEDAEANELIQSRLQILEKIDDETLKDLSQKTDGIRGFVKKKVLESFENTSIEEMDLSVRVYNVLKKYPIETFKEFEELEKDDFKSIYGARNLGKKSIEEIKEKVDFIKAEREEIEAMFRGKENDNEFVEKDGLSELEELRGQRDALADKEKALKEKVEDARELSKAYDELMGKEDTYSKNN